MWMLVTQIFRKIFNKFLLKLRSLINARQETAAPPPETAAPDNLHGSPKNSDETHKDESEKEKSTPLDDSNENMAETSGMSERKRILENSFLESAVATPSFTSGTLSSNYSNLSSCPSSSSYGVDGVVNRSGDYSLWLNKDSFGFYVEDGDANLQKSSFSVNDGLGFQEGGLVHKIGSGTESVQQQEQEEQNEKGNGSSCTNSIQESQIKEAEKKNETLFSDVDFPLLEDTGKIVATKRHRQLVLIEDINRRRQEEEQIERGNVSSCTNSIQESQINEAEKQIEAKKENENSLPLGSNVHFPPLKDTGKIVATKRHRQLALIEDLNRSARQETAPPPETDAPNNLSGSPKNSDETHPDESEKEKSTFLDDSGEDKAETSGISERKV